MHSRIVISLNFEKQKYTETSSKKGWINKKHLPLQRGVCKYIVNTIKTYIIEIKRIGDLLMFVLFPIAFFKVQHFSSTYRQNLKIPGIF